MVPSSNSACTEREAVEELLHSTTSYEEDSGNTVWPYDRGLMSLPESGDSPVDLRKVLDPVGRELVEDPFNCMMLKDEEWAAILESGKTVKPYMLAQSDIKDYFYSLAMPVKLQPWFCLPALPASVVQAWNIERLGDISTDLEGWTFPMVRVVPIGFSWAMWLAQRAHQHLSLEASGLGLDRVVVEGKAPPSLEDGTPVLIPYADNLNVADVDSAQVQSVKDKIVLQLRRTGFRVHEELEACSMGQSLGFMIDGIKGVVTPVPDRLMKVKLAFKWLSMCPVVSV